MLPMLTMRPNPRARMPGNTARVNVTAPVSMTWSKCSHLASGNSSSGATNCNPALLTRTSTGRETEPIASATLFSEVTSSATTSAEPPWALIRPATSPAPATFRSLTTTWSPARASSAARPAPIPLAAPVMRTLLVGMARSPVEERGAPGEAASESAQDDLRSGLQLAGAGRLLQRERNAGRRRVAVALDGGDGPLHRQLQRFHDRFQHPQVALVQHQEVDVAGRKVVLAEQRADHPWHGVDREVPHLGSVHDEGVESLLQHLGADGELGAAPRHLDVPAAAAVAPQVKVNAPRRLVGLREQHRARAVAEEDAGPAVVPVHDLRERVGADDQRVAVPLGRGQHHALRDVEREDEARAHRVDVEGRALALGDAQLLLDEAGYERSRIGLGRKDG